MTQPTAVLTDEAFDEDTEHAEEVHRYDGEEDTVGTVTSMLEHLPTKAASIITGALVLLSTTSGRAAAKHVGPDCSVPTGLDPLFSLVNTLTHIAMYGGVLLAGLGLVSAGVLLAMPGEDYSRLGRKIAKNALIGLIVVLAASGIVTFLVNSMGSTICP